VVVVVVIQGMDLGRWWLAGLWWMVAKEWVAVVVILAGGAEDVKVGLHSLRIGAGKSQPAAHICGG
jgi:hypothetical protein